MPLIRVGDIDMYYEVHGSGAPLVLIGGLGNHLAEWEWMVHWCAQSHRVLAFDNRGAGRTDKPDIPYSIEMMAADTDGLMEAVGFTDAAVLGVSMGGRIALELALEHPERVSRLILVSTMASPRPDTGGPSRVEMLGILATLFDRGKYRQPRYAQARQREASRVYDAMDRLGDIHVPTTIMHGRKDRIAPFRQALAMRQAIPGSTMVSFHGGHMFFMARQRKWFLDSVATALDPQTVASAP